MDTDNQLLGAYAKTGSEHAFRELVERRINLVHSAALRESGGDASFAEDITQAVFTEMARNANALVRHPALSGWLYTCVRRMSSSVRRAEHRRQHREQEAYIMNQLLSSDGTDNLWQQVRPLLDDVMHELSEGDRTAVVLRFFEGRSLKEVGIALGLTENAARMRVERSLERIRGSLSKRGVNSTGSTLAAVLAAGAVITAPSTLASSVAAGALSGAASGTVASFSIARLLGLASAKTTVAGVMVLTVAALITWHQFRSNLRATQRITQTQPVVSNAASLANNPTGEETSAVPPGPTNLTPVPQMALQVVETETGEPLPNTKLYLFYLFADGRGKVVRTATDANGRLRVATPQIPFHGLNMFVAADGHVPKVTSWGFGRAMPAEYTMRLERGITIGGEVVDEAGQPIAGAKIEFEDPGNDMTLAENIQFGPDTETVTDANGRWWCDMIPKQFTEMSLIVNHPEHAQTKTIIHTQTPEATKSIITMAAGFTVAGIVQDSNRNPVAGAKVREVRLNSDGERSVVTDPAGAFEFKHMKAGELMLSVQATGLAPDVQTLQVTGSVAAIRFPLGPGQLLRGHCVDEDGHLLTNVFAETTRGDDRVKWSTNTDAAGRFEWDSAPPQPLVYSFLSEGFNRVYALKLLADGSDHEIKLTRQQAGKDTIQITGTVQDADTEQPVDGFRVLIGQVDPDWAAPVRFAIIGNRGQFATTPSAASLHTNYQVQIEKEGYLPALSTNLSVSDGNQALKFRLQKGSGPSGLVLLPAGEPASEATVFLCVPHAGVTIIGPAQVEKGLNTTTYLTQTDRSGKFSLPAAPDPQGIVVVHDQGYALVSLTDFASGGTITLQPWGRIEGIVTLDSHRVPNDNVRAVNHVFQFDAQGRQVRLLTLGLDTKTDATGKFSFEKVPPGQCTVFREEASPGERGIFFNSHSVSAAVNPGAVSEVALGGTGRPIIGTALLGGAPGSVDWQKVPVRLRLQMANEPGPYPRRHNFSSNEALINAMNEWDKASRSQRTFGTFCNSNGSFRLQDIPAGTYELKIRVLASKLDSVSPRQEWEPAAEIGSFVREVIVPKGQTKDPLDLGPLQLLPSQTSAAAN